MIVKDLAEKLNLNTLTGVGMNKEITNVYIGDLLSIVMTKCEEGNAWITSQTHINILNVADLNDVACIIIAGGAEIEETLAQKAQEMEIALLSSDKEAYELAWKAHEVLE